MWGNHSLVSWQIVTTTEFPYYSRFLNYGLYQLSQFLYLWQKFELLYVK